MKDTKKVSQDVTDCTAKRGHRTMVPASLKHQQRQCLSVDSMDTETATTATASANASWKPAISREQEASLGSSRRMTMTIAVPGTITATTGERRSTKARRVKVFLFVRILFQYLEKVDRRALNLAKVVVKDCEQKHKTKDSKYSTLADAISERLRDAVGESHWAHTQRIQKQLFLNQRKRKTTELGLVGLGQHCTL